MVLDLVDAAALLWRLELVGVDVADRWGKLAPKWLVHAEDHVLAFNDLHIAMTLAGAGDEVRADALEESIERYVAGSRGTNAGVSAALGLPVIRALRAFRRGDFAQVIALLAPIYKRLAPVGGSNAQRDLIIQTLGIAAYKAGDAVLAREVATERLKLKIGSPRAWSAYA
jgi:hypothetical protein